MIFDPFESRLCRDIRNDLGAGFVKSVQQRSFTPFHSSLDKFQNYIDRKPTGTYIKNRFTLLHNIINQIETNEPRIENVFSILQWFWDHQLFYEFHEWVEELWQIENGNSKKALQALILAAVACEQHHYNRVSPARKLSDKAIKKFYQFGSYLPEIMDANDFIRVLKKI